MPTHWRTTLQTRAWRVLVSALHAHMDALMKPTYRLERVDDMMTIICLLCGSQSAHPDDIDNRYCARCHIFHDDQKLPNAKPLENRS